MITKMRTALFKNSPLGGTVELSFNSHGTRLEAGNILDAFSLIREDALNETGR